MTEERKQSKEIKAIFKAIEKYCAKYDHQVVFHASFMAFEGKECDVIDDFMIAYGPKEVLQTDIKDMLKEIKKEKDDFISW